MTYSLKMTRPDKSRGAVAFPLTLFTTFLWCALTFGVALANPVLNGVWLPDSADYRDQLPDVLPYTEAGRQTVETYNHADDPVMHCLQDWGRISTVSFPVEIIVDDNQVTLLYEYGHNIRRAFMDREDFSAEYPPSLMGYSIGHWEGDELVVETEKLLSGQIYEQGIAPYSSEARATERFTLSEDGSVLTVERTIHDPTNYTEPWSWSRELTRSGWDIFPYDCTVGSYGSSMN